VVTVEPVRVGRQHLEVPIQDLRAVKVRRRRWDTHGRIRWITVSPSVAPEAAPSTGVVSGRDGRQGELAHPGVEIGDRPDGNLDLVAKGGTESAAVVVPADAAGPPHAEEVS
jgi:hypothetical protein